jgi:hypothetical protein
MTYHILRATLRFIIQRLAECKSHSIVLLLVLFGFMQVLAQQAPVEVYGTVLDASTKEPLEFATITVANRPIGTISNQAGEFRLIVPVRMLQDTLHISMVGYENYRQRISKIDTSRSLTVSLMVKPFELDEVVVSAKRMTPALVMDSVKYFIAKNYRGTPFQMDGFYRYFQRENKDLVTLMEAAVTITDDGYPANKKVARKYNEAVYIREARLFSKNEVGKNNNVNGLHQILLNNDIRYFTNSLEMAFDTMTVEYYNDRPVYVITSKEPLYKVVVDAESFALLKLRLERYFGDEFDDKFNDSTKRKLDYMVKNLEFRQYQGKSFLHYANYSFHAHDEIIKSKKVLRTHVSSTELLINDIATQNFAKLDPKSKLGRHEPVEKFVKKYNESFWKNYNVIKQTSFETKMLAEFINAQKLK